MGIIVFYSIMKSKHNLNLFDRCYGRDSEALPLLLFLNKFILP